MRGSIRNASVAFSQGHSSYASSNAIPIGIPGYYLEERGSGYSHPGAAMGRPSTDSGFGHPAAPMGRPSIDNRSRPELGVYDEPLETTYETYEDGRGSAQRDYAESPSPEPGTLIRQASIGKRTKPTLTTVKSGERMGRDGEALERKITPPKQPSPQYTMPQEPMPAQLAPRLNRAMMHSRVSSTSSEGEDMERSGQEEKALEAANASSDIITPGAIPAPLSTSKNKTPSRDNLIAHGECAILELADVEHVTIVNLDVRDLEFCDTVDNDASRIVLLSTRLSVETGLIEQDSKQRTLGNLLS